MHYKSQRDSSMLCFENSLKPESIGVGIGIGVGIRNRYSKEPTADLDCDSDSERIDCQRLNWTSDLFLLAA
jgi:hypothetical protein